MKQGILVRYMVTGMLIVTSWMITSCNSFNEHLPECRLFVKFKYDETRPFTDAVPTPVDKGELAVFDKEGLF